MSSDGKKNVFRKVHHLCIVVPDIEKAVEYYESVGIGPWKDFPPLGDLPVSSLTREEMESWIYKSCDLENIQFQLCQPLPSTTRKYRFLQEHGGGVYHIGFGVPDIEEAEQACLDMGLVIGERGRKHDGEGFTYFDTREDAGVVLEIRSNWNP
ncbi:VOC family protein [Bosea vestrisii]|uniref:VOC family protein n=1 Tax=Bosea vestrisii TaxID=151416 RepID=UPI0024DF4F16|nr:VOC family protein [Bosea vestrisii]WID95227.1 VOC family protein [Bosea vestrisii]